MSLSSAFGKARYLLALALMTGVWLVLGMVYFDKFLRPFDRLVPLLMPWKGLHAMPARVQGGLEERLSIMRGLLDASAKVADIAFLVTAVSFCMLSIYLTLLYQQKQRRSRENRLLILKNQEIARRNEFIRYISATIGHEFKNNLGRIKRRVDLLPDLSPEVKTRIDDNMDKLFADIDIFKKISDEREAGLIDFAGLDLREMLEDLARQYGDLAEITFRSAAPPSTIFASKVLLKTVFENLVDNAIKYKKPDQPHARITVSGSIDVDGSRRYVSLAFRDEGVGMSEQQTANCFYKGKSSLVEGWGEGLYFAKYVVGLHAGKIRVGREYTSPGRGTEIIINLPFVEEALYV
ncbi:MAG: HAMP domain-containing histidine kinase [Nitrospirae bacterium]|nr:HAMP domain-containing histidine kinase [Nitrospirota bacterium]